MSVCQPKKKDGSLRSQIYQFDFWLTPTSKLEPERFFGSTGQRTKAAAVRVENEFRELAKLGKLKHKLTVQQVCDDYWDEKMVRARSSDDQAINLEHI